MAEAEAEFDPTLDSTATNVARVMKHVLQKGFQMGGVLGVGVVAPVLLYRHTRRGGQVGEALPKLAEAVYHTASATTALSAALGAVRLATVEDLKAGVQDRAYRLHYNQGQNRADLFAQIGMAAGGAAAVAFLPASAAVVVGSAAAGAACGIMAHVATARSREA